jgi:heat shock protein HslJ
MFIKLRYSSTLLFISIFVIFSCNKNSVDTQDLLGKKWILTELEYLEEELDPIDEIYIEFSETEATGSGGCNAFFADYELSDEQLAITGLGYTEMACGNGISELENKFFDLLSNAEKLMIDGSELSIHCENGELEFEKD